MSVVVPLYAEHGIGSHYIDADGYPWSSLWASEPYQCALCGRLTQRGYCAPGYGVDLCTRCVVFVGHVLDCPDCGARWLWKGKLPAPSKLPRCGAVIAIRRHRGRERRCRGRLTLRRYIDPHRRAS